MKSLSDHMSVYAAYHRNPVNRFIHYIFVPAIVWTLMVALDHVTLYTTGDLSITLAIVIVAALLMWYLLLDMMIGFFALIIFTALLVGAIELNNAVSMSTSLYIAGGLFVASWVFQFIGHGVWEKRRPALMDNLFQVLVAPLFLISEAAFMLGLRKNLEAEVEEKMQAHLPA